MERITAILGIYTRISAQPEYPDIDAKNWISVGDCWIDGKASPDAGVSFIDYQGDWSKMEVKNISPYCINKKTGRTHCTVGINQRSFRYCTSKASR